jgi:hypothetical protein
MLKDNAQTPEGTVKADKQNKQFKQSKIMEGKIKITDKAMLKKIPAAAEQAGVKLKEPFTAGGAVHQPLTFRDPAHLFDFGLIVALISEKEVADFEKRMAEKAAKKAAA